MQTARPIIAQDLGPDAPKGAVQDEGQRRWAIMDAAEKQGWNQAYQYNLRLYNARVHSYKRGNINAKDMSDAEAFKYAEEYHIEMPASAAVEEPLANEQDAIAQQLQQGVVQEAGEEEGAAEAKTPRKAAAKDSRKRKTATPAAAPEADTSKAAATPASPDKKRKRTSKAAAEVEEPKKSGRKKTKSG
ncbi:hypothetical protein VTK73DRAFT_6547 [Phialemonium thermophilum]|uniref:Uncharacterized protein n=1 Tax=Phialemonium thermophilum TaxID=223376 RepID=A0ABR3XWG9_9PEZI